MDTTAPSAYRPLFERGKLGPRLLAIECLYGRRLHVFFKDGTYILAVWMKSEDGTRRNIGNVDLEPEAAQQLALILSDEPPGGEDDPPVVPGRYGRAVTAYWYEGTWVLSLGATSVSSGRRRTQGSIDLSPPTAQELARTLREPASREPQQAVIRAVPTTPADHGPDTPRAPTAWAMLREELDPVMLVRGDWLFEIEGEYWRVIRVGETGAEAWWRGFRFVHV